MKALILAGGQSKRMGRNKALIERPDGSRQVDHIAGLARGVCDTVLLSIGECESGGVPLPWPRIPDLHPGEGPLAALEAAAAACGGPLLVIGCDLFLLDAPTLACLMANRDPTRAATCYRNRIDGRPEPLCAIYEEPALAKAAAALMNGNRNARDFLESLDPHIIDLPHPAALDGANSPTELAECFAKLRCGVTAKSLGLHYFGGIREVRGVGFEAVESLACTVAGLYEELRFRHRLRFVEGELRVEIHGKTASWETLLHHGDEVAFFLPGNPP